MSEATAATTATSAPTSAPTAAATTSPTPTTHPFLSKLLATKNYVQLNPYADLTQGPNLTAGLLMSTADCVSKPTVLQSSNKHIEETGRCDLFAVYRLGDRTSGHGGIVHGGCLATLLDESLCRCGFALLPHHVGVTASLNLQYKAPTPTGSIVLLHAQTDRVEGRKVWVKGWIHVLEDGFMGELSDLDVRMEADLLAIEPRWYEKLLGGAAVKAERERASAE